MTGPGSEEDAVARWAASGAMALTGRADGPALGPPAGLVPFVDELGARISGATGLAHDWLALLGERAALAGLTRGGDRSCGGHTRLIPTSDGWLAISIARPDDLDLLPAWLGADPGWTDLDHGRWDAVAALVARHETFDLVAQGALLGLPVAGLAEVGRTSGSSGPSDAPNLGLGASRGRQDPQMPRTSAAALGDAPPLALADATVVDLTGLWAGPLCGGLLAEAGADVVKVESTARPDGARWGPKAFFELLNGGKRTTSINLRTTAGIDQLRKLILSADVVLESSRPRALEQLGLVAADLVERGPQVWLSITGHGRAPDRVAFGDDGAVAGGLVVHDEAGPCFCADAVADPLAGLAATAEVAEALQGGGRWLIDAPLAAVAAAAAGPTLPAADHPVAPPRAREVGQRT